MSAELKVWWIPQIPMKAFEYPVSTLETAETLTDALAKYDLFQFENNVKGDYANAGGISWRHPVATGGEWWDLDPDDPDDVDEYLTYAGKTGA